MGGGFEPEILDDHLEGGAGGEAGGLGEAVSVGESRRGGSSASSDLLDPERSSSHPKCGQWVGRLHCGAMRLHTAYGEVRVLADIDHVYQYFRHGFIENARSLH